MPHDHTKAPSSTAKTVGSWAERGALPSLMPVAPALPPELLPETLRPWLLDVAERAQIPLEFVAAPAVVALSSLIGRSVGIHPKQYDDWLVVPNLWGALIGRPGVLKSPAVTEALKPLQELAKEAQELHKRESAEADAEAEVLKMQIAALRDRGKAAARKSHVDELAGVQADLADLKERLEKAIAYEKRYVINDGTVEKIGELLNENPRGLLLSRDELSGWLRNLDREDRRGDREFYLEAWNGTGSYTYDRIGRGTTHVDALTLSVFGTIQPGKLQAYVLGALTSGQSDDGLLQRFQVVVWPETSPEWCNVDRSPDIDAKNRAVAVFRRLDELAIAGDAAGDIRALRFTPDAQDFFDEWRAGLESRLRDPDMEASPAFESHLAKYRSLVPSLALVFQLVEAGVVDAVNLEAARNAAEWCHVLEAHAAKIYAAELLPDINAAHALANKIKIGAIVHGATVREIYRPQWSGLSDPETVSAGLIVLERYHWLRVSQRKTGARPADVIELHPDLRGVAI